MTEESHKFHHGCEGSVDSCPLCHSTEWHQYHEDKKRRYCQCQRCALVFVPKAYHLSQQDEKAEYDKHQNNPDDEGYRRFLARCIDPLLQQLPFKHATRTPQGLDFGCGPGPTISVMMAEQGIPVANYDLYYYHQPQLLERHYDFITMTEVAEHLAQPGEVFARLASLLNPGGILAVMTKRVIDKTAFARWHYKNDPTHICFFSEQTFAWLAERLGMTLTVVAKDVVFLQRKAP